MMRVLFTKWLKTPVQATGRGRRQLIFNSWSRTTTLDGSAPFSSSSSSSSSALVSPMDIQSSWKVHVRSSGNKESNRSSSEGLKEKGKKEEMVVILDCSSSETYLRGHIPGAQPMPYAANGLKDPSDPTQLTALSAEMFEKAMDHLGIKKDTTMVFYDDQLNMKATRAWWLARHFGHDKDKLKVLDGGLHRWIVDQLPLESGPTSNKIVSSPPGTYRGKGTAAAKSRLVDLKYVQRCVRDGKHQFVDARSAGEFDCMEPMMNKHAGRVPGSLNFEWKDAIQADASCRFKSKKELESLLLGKGGLVMDSERPVITYCQLGLRGAHAAFVLENILGVPNVFVYEGSMKEYLNRDDTDIEIKKRW